MNVVLGLLVLAAVDEGRVSRGALIWYALVLLAAALRFGFWFRFRRGSAAGG